jgi:hypothetical protein
MAHAAIPFAVTIPQSFSIGLTNFPTLEAPFDGVGALTFATAVAGGRRAILGNDRTETTKASRD